MYPRQKKTRNQNNRNNRNTGHTILNVRDDEDSLFDFGNEAAGQLDDIPNLESNEANNAILGGDDTLSHYAENDLNNLTLNTGKRNSPKNLPAEIKQEGLGHYFENDLNNWVTKKGKKKHKDRGKAIDINKSLDISQDLNIGKESDNNEEEHRIDLDEDESQDMFGPLVNEDQISLIQNVIEKAPKPDSVKNGEKGSKAPKKSSAAKAAVPRERSEDLTQVDESLEPAQGWDFVAQKLPARKKQGFLSKLVSWAAFYSGKTIGKIGGIIAAIGKGLWGLVRPGPGTMGGTFKRLRGSSSFKPRRDRDLIPGWDGAKYEHENEPEDDIDLDFRRVPEIWSTATAEQPVEGDAEDRNAKPRDPVISVYISQGSPKYTVTDKGSTGHTGIGIEYSRYSAKSGRWQRYKVRFGYYIGGGGASLMSKMAVSSYNNATIPGKLMDENSNYYDISRSFPMKPQQVGKVLRAAESYADRGGYNQYTRNCTTFAKEMVVDVAKIKGAEGIFAKDEIYLQKKQDAKMFGAGAMAPLFKADMENGFEKMRTREDLDYNNYGNQMATREDYERYKNSLSLWSSHTTEGHSPNATAENMRRTEGGKSGMIGSYLPAKTGEKVYKEAPISVVTQEIMALVRSLKTTLTSITPLDQLTDAKMTPELKELLTELDDHKIFVSLITLFPQQDEKLFQQKTSQDKLVKGRTLMTDLIKKLNTLLFKYYRNDKRVQKKVLPLISVLNHGINAIDKAYLLTDEDNLTQSSGELKDIENDFGRKQYNITYKGKQVEMSGSEYEAWIQIYNTPQKALEQYSRYYTLRNKSQSKQTTAAEEKELEKLRRINALSMDFQRSHRYMLTKEKFSQQDVDYALSLQKKEQQPGIKSEMFGTKDEFDPTMSKMENPNASASGTYLMLIMKGVFGGMKERWHNHFKNGYWVEDLAEWVSADASDCIRSHEKEITAILRGLKHTTENPDEDKLNDGFKDLFIRWLFQLFRNDLGENNYREMALALTNDKSGQFMEEIDKIITNVMKE